VLTAFSNYDCKVDYVQGMNFIVAALLYHCSETLSFWLFVSLIEDYQLRDIYIPGLPGLYMHTQIIEMLVMEKIPLIFSHFVIVLLHYAI